MEILGLSFVVFVVVVLVVLAAAYLLPNAKLDRVAEKSLTEDPREWLRQNRRKEMTDWEMEYAKLSGIAPTAELTPSQRVEALQRLLADRYGYDGPADGVWGQTSQAAFERYQRDLRRGF